MFPAMKEKSCLEATYLNELFEHFRIIIQFRCFFFQAIRLGRSLDIRHEWTYVVLRVDIRHLHRQQQQGPPQLLYV